MMSIPKQFSGTDNLFYCMNHSPEVLPEDYLVFGCSSVGEASTDVSVQVYCL